MTSMKEVEITRSEELNDRETEEIASVLEGARPSNRIDAIAEGLRSPGLQAKLEELEQRKQAIEA